MADKKIQMTQRNATNDGWDNLYPKTTGDQVVASNGTTFESHLADYVRQPGYAVTEGTSTAYTVTLNPAPLAYVDGMQITIVPHVDCGVSPTLNVNGLGALAILKQDGSAISAGDLKANKPYSLVRVGSNFFLRSISGSNIKSIQRGEATFSAGVASLDISINSVDISKAIIRITNKADNSYASRVMIGGYFTSSTNINFTRQNGTTFSQTFAWEVIEFNNVKSMQTGVFTPSASTTNITVNSVDINKSLLFVTVNTSNYDTSLQNGFIQYSVVDSTTIKFIVSFNNVYNIRWQLIEFN